MSENTKINELNERDNLTEEEKKFIQLMKLDNYVGIKNILNTDLPPKKIWEYKTPEKDNSTILHISILHNSNKIITRIVNYSKNYLSKEELKSFINKKNKSGATSLHLASFKGNIKIINLLISNGGDVYMLTEKLLNVIHYACQGNKPNCLFYYDLNYKFDFNSVDKKNTSPLHWACYSSSYECVNFLIQKKINDININCQDLEGNTPLHLAISSGVAKIVRLLLQNGASINIKNNSGLTPAQLAQKEKRIEIFNIIQSNKKWVVCNLRAPAKKVNKSKKYAVIIIIFKFINYYAMVFHIYPFLILHRKNDTFNFTIFFIHILINISLLILFIYLICSNPGYVDYIDKINDYEHLLIKKKETFLDFCFKCSVFKTETIKHCVICDRCCKGFDHHCLWLDNCIGQNNYFSFKVILYNFFLDIIIAIILSLFSIIAFYSKANSGEVDKKNYEKSIDSVFDFVKYCLNKIEIDPNYIHIIAIIFLCINFLIMIPLIYLIRLHCSLCNRRESKINPMLIKYTDDVSTESESQKLYCATNDFEDDEISLV